MSSPVPMRIAESSQPVAFMTDLRKLLRYSSHHVVGRAVGMALGFISFPLFTRIFSVSDYGIVNLVLQAALVFTVLSKAGLQNSVQRFELEIVNEGPARYKQFFSTIFCGNAAIAVCFSALFAALGLLAPSRLVPGEIRPVIVLASVLIAARAVRSMYTNMLQVEGKTVTLNVLEIVIRAVGIVTICAFALAWRRSAMGFFAGLVLAEGGAILVLFPEFRRRMGRQIATIDPTLFRKFLRFGLPMMWAELAWVVLACSDRFLVQYFRGTEAVGYYSAAYNVSNYAQEFIVTPLNLAFFPVCVSLWTSRGKTATEEFLGRTLSYFFVAAVALVAGTVLVSNDIIVLLASRRYSQAHILLPWLVAGLTLSALQVFFKTCLMLQHQPDKVARATTIAAGLNIASNLILIPRLGILGAALSTLVSSALWIILMARAAFRVLPFPIHYLQIARFVGIAIVAGFVASQFTAGHLIVRLLLRSGAFLAVYIPLIAMLDARLRADVRQWFRSEASVPQPIDSAEAIGRGGR